MKQVVKNLMVAAAGLTLAASAAFGASAQEARTLDQLLQQVQQQRAAMQRIDEAREREFMSDRADKQALLRQAQQQLRNEQQRSTRLQEEYAQNEINIANKETELDNMVGTLGEIFGVIRGAASDTIGRISTSIVSAQYPDRHLVLESLAQARELPNIGELEELWLALLTEMTESGKVARYQGEVTLLDGGSEVRDVIRIGAFNLISDGEYLLYNDATQQIQPIARQPAGHILRAASNFENTNSGFAGVFVDPSRGQILSLLTQKATLSERYHQGQTVGYAITVVLILGFVIAIYKLVTLTAVGGAIRRQLKNPQNPSDKNPLGRILKVYHENPNTDAENLELKLDEAILRETPKVEAGVNIIKILAAIAPLMGLLGTVVGMIGTFQSITLFGTGDPRIMAGDISMALVTTAMGLIAALPLIVIHSIVASKSKSILHILDEQAAGIVASHAEKKGA
ncbi:MotA/TolQ/ExbB proton channel family protein [Aliidiomarina haloalkalitolerans]|uniref:Flagellar motor protein MotA n=1 Tax=Aliidiomarina haloalkalitolerans TaxID=859059 RepID=A0A432VXL5_9GAMM|nr:MotA/TolQ/ExbB proton channel family protein [Aliidiomarina haloalkalitolerans]RUO21315.1 flagellar motor protein MotA [Aliidiomarina haloalkalitolerans]